MILRQNFTLPTGTPTHCTNENVVGHKISAGYAEHSFRQHECVPVRKNSAFFFLYQSPEAFEGCHLSKKAGKVEKQLDPAPQQHALTHLPRSTAASGEEANSNHPPATIFSRPHFVQLPPLLQSQDWCHYLASIEEIQQNATAGHTAIPQEALQKCFQQ
jgi:hypothetical protein